MTEIIRKYRLNEAEMASTLTRSLGVERIEVRGEGYTLGPRWSRDGRLAVHYGYAWRCGAAWVWWYLKTPASAGLPCQRHLRRLSARIVATVRAAWFTFARGHMSELCQFCARPYVSWWAPEDLWNRYMGGYGGLCCPDCFDRMASMDGVRLHWAPELEEHWRRSA